MPDIDSTISITTILALVAIISPILTALINNIFQLILKYMEKKQKRYEQDTLHRREIFENFLSAFNEVCHRQDDATISRYAASYSLVYIYLPEKVRKDLGLVNLLIANYEWDEAIKYVDAISMDIYREMQKLKL